MCTSAILATHCVEDDRITLVDGAELAAQVLKTRWRRRGGMSLGFDSMAIFRSAGVDRAAT